MYKFTINVDNTIKTRVYISIVIPIALDNAANISYIKIFKM